MSIEQYEHAMNIHAHKCMMCVHGVHLCVCVNVRTHAMACTCVTCACDYVHVCACLHMCLHFRAQQ